MLFCNQVSGYRSTYQNMTDENMSPGDTSDSSDGEGPEAEVKEEPSHMTPSSKTILSQSQTATTTSPITTTSVTPTKPQQSSLPSSSSTTATQASILPPLVYQTAQGMMYATPSNGSVIFSLAQADPNLGHAQQLIIPLSVMTANGQGELDLSKRK